MIRVLVVGGTLMFASAIMRQSTPEGDCRPCGPELRAAQQLAPSQQNDSMYVVGVYDPSRNPANDLELAVSRATAEDKRILIQVGGDWCFWCHILDEYIKSEKEISVALDRDFLILKVNFDTGDIMRPR